MADDREQIWWSRGEPDDHARSGIGSGIGSDIGFPAVKNSDIGILFVDAVLIPRNVFRMMLQSEIDTEMMQI